MTQAYKKAVNEQLTASAAAYYTVGTGRKARIVNATVHNTHTSAVTVDVYVVDSGETRGDEHLIIKNKSIGSNETVFLSHLIGHVLGAGDSVDALASTTTVANLLLSVVEVT